MPYTFAVSVSDKEALHEARYFNIEPRGLVPNNLMSWGVLLNCTGEIVGEPHVNITINVPLHKSIKDITSIVIQRKKTCSPFHAKKLRNSTGALYFTVGSLGLFIAVVSVVAALKHRKTDKIKRRDTSKAIKYRDPQPICRASKSTNNGITWTFLRTPSSETSTSAVSSEGKLDATKIKSVLENLTMGLVLIEGTFAKIISGQYEFNSEKVDVMIKTVSECASDEQRRILLSESTLLFNLQHENLTQLLSVIEGPNSPLVVIRSYCQLNLKRYLKQSHSMPTNDAVQLSLQMLRGLAFLHSHGSIHRDVACRNCWIDESLRLVIGDFALSRDLFPSDYHCLGDNENRPVKWQAYESLTRREFSAASDVWSWGVAVWEVMTLAHQPYDEIDPFEMVRTLSEGVRLAQPINCPDELFKPITLCWTINEEMRPQIEELITYLTNFILHLNRYV